MPNKTVIADKKKTSQQTSQQYNLYYSYDVFILYCNIVKKNYLSNSTPLP